MKDAYNHKRCKVCKESYKDSINSLRYIKDKYLRLRLKHLFETLWLNNCGDFDIIYYDFAINLKQLKDK